MTRLALTPWNRFKAEHDGALVRRWMQGVGDRTHLYFRSKMEASRGGRVYTHELRTINGRVLPVRKRPRGPHKASAPGDFPAKDTGRLINSIRKETTSDEMTIGTTMFYARYLKRGTKRMKRRKMSSDALKETLPSARSGLRGFAKWRR